MRSVTDDCSDRQQNKLLIIPRVFIFVHGQSPGSLLLHLTLLFIQIWAVFQGAVHPGCEADHSPPSSVVVNNAWSHTSTLPYARMAKR